MMSVPIRWVFFDVGSVLFHDRLQSLELLRTGQRHLSRLDDSWTFQRLLEVREERVRQGQSYVVTKLLTEHLGEAEAERILSDTWDRLKAEFDANHLLMPGTEAALDRLGERYRLGVIANQPEEARHSLARRGLLDRFEVVAISDEVGLSKPDPELYRWAVERVNERADDPPASMVMVGDRIDNDVRPAAEVGMRTVLFGVPDEHAPWQPETDEEHAFLASIGGTPLFDTARESSVRPDAEASSMAELVHAIERLDADARG